jgi:hypothetical protein
MSYNYRYIRDYITSGKIHTSLNNEATLLDPLDNSYLERSQAITRYLIILKRPKGILRSEFRKLSREA